MCLRIKQPSGSYDQIFITVRQLRVCWCGALSLTTGRFTIAADPRQRSHSRVRVPWDSRPYFTLSYTRLPFLSLSATRRATVEVFDPASTRDPLNRTRSVESYSVGADYTENTASITSSIVWRHRERVSCRRCIATVVVYRFTSQQRVYTLQYHHHKKIQKERNEFWCALMNREFTRQLLMRRYGGRRHWSRHIRLFCQAFP
jgi:hypothetical protein